MGKSRSFCRRTRGWLTLTTQLLSHLGSWLVVRLYNGASLVRRLGKELFHAETIFFLWAPSLCYFIQSLLSFSPKPCFVSSTFSLCLVSGRGQSWNHNKQKHSLWQLPGCCAYFSVWSFFICMRTHKYLYIWIDSLTID